MKKFVRSTINQLRVYNKTKIFCIGCNKTGTTSLELLFRDLGYIVGNQREAELLMHSYNKREFQPIINYCKSAQVFQDVPFSLHETFMHMDKKYPQSLFILTLRDSPGQWYDSLVKFHSKLFGQGDVPSSKQLKDCSYVSEGWVWNNHKSIYNTPENDPYHRETFINYYNVHNTSIIDYFSKRPEKLLTINLADQNSFSEFCEFLNIETNQKKFPWENQTKDLNVYH